MAIRDIYSRFDAEARQPSRASRTADRRMPAGDAAPGLLSVLWRRKLTILATVMLFLAGGILYIAITPPRYLASTAILIDPRLGKTVGADPVQPGFIVDTGAIDSQIKLLTSETVLSRAAKIADLQNDPEFNGSDRSLLQRLLHPDVSLDGGTDLKALEDAITIKRPERTYVVSIEVLAKNAKKAATIANAVTQAYIEDQVSSRVDAARDDTRYVGKQLSKLADEIKVAENKIEAFKIKNNVVDSNGLRSNEQQVADLTKALGEVRARESDAKAKLEQLRRMQRNGQLAGSSEALKSLTIERLRQQQAETAQNVAKLAKTLGPLHPELIEARGREARVEKLIHDELRRVAEATEGDYKSALRNEQQIAAEVEQLKSQSTELSRNLVPLGQLERNVKVLRASFDRYAQIRDNLGQQGANSPPGRVIAVARPPVSPAQPKKKIVAIVSLAAGLFFGFAAALLAEGTSPPPGEDPSRYDPFPGDEVPPRREPPRSYERSSRGEPSSRNERARRYEPPPEPSVVYDEPPAPPKPRARPKRRYWDDDDDWA